MSNPPTTDACLDYFPAFLKVSGKPCLLVGAGEVAARKARSLLAAGADLVVVAPEAGPAIAELAAGHRLRYIARKFSPADVAGKWLVISASNDAAVQDSVFAAADAAGVYCSSVDDIDNSSFITPAIVDRSPVIVAISSAGAAPVLARRIRAQIETLLPSGLGQLADLARRFRSRVKARIVGISARRRFWERVFDSPIASAINAGRVEAAENGLMRLLEDAAGRGENPGEAWLVGAGPGDPGLLTLRALQIMQVADVIVHDRLVSGDVLALARRDAELISVGKKPGCRLNRQSEINTLIVNLVRKGKRVCRLKGGDPFIFGRGGEEVEALAAAGLPYQVVPGITAAAGCAAYAGIPLTHRDASQSVVLLTAHGKDSIDRLDWASLARDRQTLALYMAVHRFHDVMTALIAHGRSADTPVAIIENGTTAKQRVLRGTLGQLPLLARAHRIRAPAILVIGAVARLGTESGWFGDPANASDTATITDIAETTAVANQQ